MAAYTVTQVNKYIRNMMENDAVLNSLLVKGEISNLKYHSSGHIYFSLKDKTAVINCVMFKMSALSLNFELKNGISVQVLGYISVFEKTGQFQLVCEYIKDPGEGSQGEALKLLKEKLLKEGLFEASRKKAIPKHPGCIAVITSPVGAAVRDVINVISRRDKGVLIAVVPVLVQGEFAAESIVSALKTVNKWGKADTIILGRGGGSNEDLSAFNEESVVRAVFESDIPVISAIGHETDYTLTDFASDLRAPTPSAAAELAVKNSYETADYIKNIVYTMNIFVLRNLNKKSNNLDSFLMRPVFKRPEVLFGKWDMYVDTMKTGIEKEIKFKIGKSESRFFSLIKSMEALSPFEVMKRGYAVLYGKSGEFINSTKKISIGEPIKVLMRDGSILAEVLEKGN
ncbi:MAG: exodeoxyribonuclease VII large subunit [Lachnospiraceae bacterium]|nr:exodeoxyribonuclease VII large subunit [Lachnospiraceae bacterium]